MHVAIGYRWSPFTAAYHLERALLELGHTVTYVGLPSSQRPGYDSMTSISEVIGAFPQKPDLYLWVDPFGRYFPAGLEEVPIPTACYLIDVHLGTWREQVAGFFDSVFVAQKDYLDSFRRVVGHQQVYWLPLAAASDVHRQLDLDRVYDVGFVGNISVAHRDTPRARRLKLVADRFRTNDLYRSYLPEEVGRVYSQSRIVFNTSIAGDVNMRVFEGTASGALMLTDSGANGLNDLFEVGREVVVFKDDDDLLEKIAYYLAHEDERRQIAEAGHRRTQAQHTYVHRVRALLDAMAAPGFQQLAPEPVSIRAPLAVPSKTRMFTS
ncbi:MAG: glycosyltransferase, partial [Chloroflexi bacterium]|nr:glycosyltransferase [Chloroflexota bacterium]